MTSSNSSTSVEQHERGQVLVIAAAVLAAVTITILFYLNLQRAFNLANFLDETTELMAQAALQPKQDAGTGQLVVNEDQAYRSALGALDLSVDAMGAEISDAQVTILKNQVLPPAGQPSLTIYEKGDSSCSAINPDGSPDCLFPAVEVELGLDHSLFGYTIRINSRGVATLGDNPAFNNPNPNPVITPEPTPNIGPFEFTP